MGRKKDEKYMVHVVICIYIYIYRSVHIYSIVLSGQTIQVCVGVAVCVFSALLTVDLHSDCTKGNPKSVH